MLFASQHWLSVQQLYSGYTTRGRKILVGAIFVVHAGGIFNDILRKNFRQNVERAGQDPFPLRVTLHQ